MDGVGKVEAVLMVAVKPKAEMEAAAVAEHVRTVFAM